jgi:pyruvate dehydrogenase E1 component alpha subunit
MARKSPTSVKSAGGASTENRKVTSPPGLTSETLLKLYRTMLTIRRFEERFAELVLRGTFSGTGHLYAGQEAVAAGVCAHLSAEDYITSTHRGHGHCIAKGVDLSAMMAELFGKATGSCKGKGGSMHIADPALGMLGANGVVGAGIPLACGAALTAQVRESGAVAVSFFGEGAANIGPFHEGLNLAAIWKLPVVFICENNIYAESTPVDYAMAAEHVADRATSYSIPGVIADGQDAIDVYNKAGEAIERARNGSGPTLIECLTYRYYGHNFADPQAQYRTKEEVAHYKSRDCITRMQRQILEQAAAAEADLEEIAAQVEQSIDEAVEFAERSPDPDPSIDLLTDVYVKYL